MPDFFVYIATNASRTLYTGVTNNLQVRMWQHRQGATPGFTAKYRCTTLAYYETFPSIRDATTREKEIKGWLRERKIQLIESMNPKWFDLSSDWY